MKRSGIAERNHGSASATSATASTKVSPPSGSHSRKPLSTWNLRYATPDPGRCAGCGKRIAGKAGLKLPDGAQLHLEDLYQRS